MQDRNEKIISFQYDSVNITVWYFEGISAHYEWCAGGMVSPEVHFSKAQYGTPWAALADACKWVDDNAYQQDMLRHIPGEQDVDSMDDYELESYAAEFAPDEDDDPEPTPPAAAVSERGADDSGIGRQEDVYKPASYDILEQLNEGSIVMVYSHKYDNEWVGIVVRDANSIWIKCTGEYWFDQEDVILVKELEDEVNAQCLRHWLYNYRIYEAK